MAVNRVGADGWEGGREGPRGRVWPWRRPLRNCAFPAQWLSKAEELFTM